MLNEVLQESHDGVDGKMMGGGVAEMRDMVRDAGQIVDDVEDMDSGSNKRSLDALLNDETQRSSLLPDKDRSLGVLPKLNDFRGLDS